MFLELLGDVFGEVRFGLLLCLLGVEQFVYFGGDLFLLYFVEVLGGDGFGLFDEGGVFGDCLVEEFFDLLGFLFGGF